MQWHGNQIRKTGFLVCPTCQDMPNPTMRPIKLPADPVPILNPRSEPMHCHVFKPRADTLKPEHLPPTADTSNRMFPPVDMWRDITVDTGSVCDARTYKDGWSVPVPPVFPPIPIEPPDATTDNTNATADTTGATADISPVMDPVLIAHNTADTTGIMADNANKLVNVFPDYLYAADITTTKTDDTSVRADNLK
jgi:hypothetical protein